MKQSIPTLVLFLSILVFSQCSKDKTNNNSFTVDCSTVTNKAFAANISPLIQSRCAIPGCHAAGSGNGPGQLISYSDIANAASRIRIVIGNGAMPQGSSLTTAEKNSIVCWIDSGKPNN